MNFGIATKRANLNYLNAQWMKLSILSIRGFTSLNWTFMWFKNTLINEW